MVKVLLVKGNGARCRQDFPYPKMCSMVRPIRNETGC